MKITGFNHLTIRVNDLRQSLPFYLDVLGMKLVHRGRSDVYLEWGEAWICLIETKQRRRQEGMGIDHVAFTIAEENFSEAVSRLKQHGVPFVREPVFRGGGWSVQFTDPDGTVLELFTGTLEKRMKNWR
ncbi:MULTISPECIES: VOC family protein [unclassified Thermoactinomyces]|jgi:catechol 2,3-dioxygenase-like lactoylglutathione lyase family enzyme|uniref:VOC family protein n=1 Tax=unclassified Thermoactinomyces TaxID=2634588 RepID=UPI0018DD4656|nr:MULTISPECIES: VOC family protein [unclassified Thermoactinomyces]MBH8598998.1 VOC family protein [Thermoactinomyces sp. CICC 10523]MBH8608424.1 VOC family protein [Thermoactinomyces sp. CICC 10521]